MYESFLRAPCERFNPSSTVVSARASAAAVHGRDGAARFDPELRRFRRLRGGPRGVRAERDGAHGVDVAHELLARGAVRRYEAAQDLAREESYSAAAADAQDADSGLRGTC